jgi:hypothetical protein
MLSPVLRFFLGIAVGVVIGAAGVGGWSCYTDESDADDGSDGERRLAAEYAGVERKRGRPGER